TTSPSTRTAASLTR
ncbi:hypothetical protein D030_2748B, partial [Vibrio parahaemolyticus AQ3810]